MSSSADTTSKPSNPALVKSKDDMPTQDKVTQLSEFMEKCKFAMMTTHAKSTDRLVSRCMALGAQESGGLDPLFFTNIESGKTSDLESDASLNIAFLDATGQWASISGIAEISTDRAIIQKHYTPALKAWLGDLGDGTHDGGPNDPRIGAIRVKAESITYSVYERGIVGRAVEYAKGMATGEVPGFNKIRELTEAEVKQWRSTQ